MHDYTKQRPRGCGRQNSRHNRSNTNVKKSMDEFIQRKKQRERCLRRSSDIQNKLIIHNQELWNSLSMNNQGFWK